MNSRFWCVSWFLIEDRLDVTVIASHSGKYGHVSIVKDVLTGLQAIFGEPCPGFQINDPALDQLTHWHWPLCPRVQVSSRPEETGQHLQPAKSQLSSSTDISSRLDMSRNSKLWIRFNQSRCQMRTHWGQCVLMVAQKNGCSETKQNSRHHKTLEVRDRL